MGNTINGFDFEKIDIIVGIILSAKDLQKAKKNNLCFKN